VLGDGGLVVVQPDQGAVPLEVVVAESVGGGVVLLHVEPRRGGVPGAVAEHVLEARVAAADVVEDAVEQDPHAGGGAGVEQVRQPGLQPAQPGDRGRTGRQRRPLGAGEAERVDLPPHRVPD
jgi:hypothetical protein